MGLLLAEAKFRWNSQSLRTGLVREGFSEEGELEPVLKGGEELDKQEG